MYGTVERKYWYVRPYVVHLSIFLLVFRTYVCMYGTYSGKSSSKEMKFLRNLKKKRELDVSLEEYFEFKFCKRNLTDKVA